MSKNFLDVWKESWIICGTDISRKSIKPGLKFKEEEMQHLGQEEEMFHFCGWLNKQKGENFKKLTMPDTQDEAMDFCFCIL